MFEHGHPTDALRSETPASASGVLAFSDDGFRHLVDLGLGYQYVRPGAGTTFRLSLLLFTPLTHRGEALSNIGGVLKSDWAF